MVSQIVKLIRLNMSKIGTFALASAIEFKIEKPCHCLILDWKTSDVGIVNVMTTSPKDALQYFASDEVVLDIRVQEKNGNVRKPFPQLPLSMLAELQSANDNHIVARKNAVTGEYILSMYIPFSDSGAIAFDNDETMTVKISSNPSFALDVYALDHKVIADTYSDIEIVSVQASAKEKAFDTDGWSTVLLKLSDLTNSTTFTFYHTNGKVIEYTNREIELMGLLSNEVCFDNNGQLLSGFGLYAVLDVRDVTKLEMSRSSSSAFDFYVERENVTNDFQKAIVQNQRLKDTTVGRKMSFIEKNIKA